MAETNPTGVKAPEHARHHIAPLRRIYAFILIAVVVFVSYRAFEYLVVQLLVPREAPAQITRIPARLTEEVWQSDPEQWLGMQLAEQPRTPLAHYHHLDGWFQSDPVNDCTRSGCHSPLPHAERKEDRAFLNMHATSIHCGVCHMTSDQVPLPLVWYALDNGRPTEPPALLRLYGWLHSETGQELRTDPTAAHQERLVALLDQAARQAGGDPDLERLAAQVNAPRFSSRQFQAAIELVEARLPLHFRGEYGAKLALRDAQGRPLLDHPNNDAAVREYLENLRALTPARRDVLLEQVHTRRRPSTLVCTQCHTTEQSLVDLTQVGYPPARVTALQQGWVFTMIEHIMQGNIFHLPGFVAPTTDGPATRPQPSAPEPSQE